MRNNGHVEPSALCRVRAVAAEAVRHHATADVEFSHEEVEFLNAMEAFKAGSGKKFPTLCDILRVAKALGYERGTYTDSDAPHDYDANLAS
jgi:hypothetical protein